MRSVLLSATAICVLAIFALNAPAQNNESPSVVPAQITITPHVTPPPEVAETGLGGVVRVKVSIDAGGAVTSADEVTGPDNICNQVTRADVVAMRSAAKAAALTARFNPATDKGTPVGSSTWLSFTFPGNTAMPINKVVYSGAPEKVTVRSGNPETLGSKESDKMTGGSAPTENGRSSDPPPDYKRPVNTGVRGEAYSGAPPAPSPRKIPKQISGGVLNGKAITLAKPPYPPAARAIKAEGAVTVQVLVDEEGSVFASEAISGHPLLRSAAAIAACESRFSPTQLMGQPVKISGVITYNFVP